jgi:YfiH family protein
MIKPIIPDWPASEHVRAYSTTREGGVSQGAWASLNLATHVKDDPNHVAENRRRLSETLVIPNEPYWLEQVHGTEVARPELKTTQCADAAFTQQLATPCVVMTADCLPVLFCDERGTAVAAAHAGWRGLAAGVLEQTFKCFDEPSKVMAWMGPAIGPKHFEVGDEVREVFLQQHPQAESAFIESRPGHWMADIFQLARQRLLAAGVSQIYGGGICTYADADHFYSFRRESVTGRMASLIWLSDDNK